MRELIIICHVLSLAGVGADSIGVKGEGRRGPGVEAAGGGVVEDWVRGDRWGWVPTKQVLLSVTSMSTDTGAKEEWTRGLEGGGGARMEGWEWVGWGFGGGVEWVPTKLVLLPSVTSTSADSAEASGGRGNINNNNKTTTTTTNNNNNNNKTWQQQQQQQQNPKLGNF